MTKQTSPESGSNSNSAGNWQLRYIRKTTEVAIWLLIRLIWEHLNHQ